MRFSTPPVLRARWRGLLHMRETPRHGGCTIWRRRVLKLLTKNHRITECSGLEGTSVGHLVQPSCRSRVTYSRLQRTLSRRVLNISREGDSTTSLGEILFCRTSCSRRRWSSSHGGLAWGQTAEEHLSWPGELARAGLRTLTALPCCCKDGLLVSFLQQRSLLASILLRNCRASQWTLQESLLREIRGRFPPP